MSEISIPTHTCLVSDRPTATEPPCWAESWPIFAQLTAYTDGMASGSNILLPPVLMVNPFSCCINSARVQQNAKLRWFVRGTSSLCVAWRWNVWIKPNVECSSILPLLKSNGWVAKQVWAFNYNISLDSKLNTKKYICMFLVRYITDSSVFIC